MLRMPDLPGTLASYRDVLGFELASGALWPCVATAPS